MDINVYLFIVIALMLLIIMYLLFVLRRDTACADKRRLRGYKGREFEPTYFSRRKRYDKNNLL